MAYNPFPIGYQTYQPQPMSNSSLIWVQGEQAAKSYLTAPNTTIPLWDTEQQRIYLKSTDASGMPSIKVLEYTILETSGVAKNALSGSDDKVINYATKTDLNGIYERLAALERNMKNEPVISADARPNPSEV